ncbi:hypothetical protein ABVT39_013846 [Epinephelus coioides]
MSKVYSLFLKRTIPIFDISNQILQKEEPCIHILLPTLELQLQKVLLSFCKPEHVITMMDEIGRGIKPTLYSARENQLPDEELSVGHDTQTFIQSQGKLELKPFFRDVRKFFSSAADYMVSKFPFRDEVLMHAVVADITKRQSVKFSSLRFFISHFPSILPEEVTVDQMEDEFRMYQTSSFEDSILSKRADEAWVDTGHLKRGGQEIFSILSAVMLGILVIFHSNADCERIFSLVTKNKTQYRASLSSDMISALVTRKGSGSPSRSSLSQLSPSSQATERLAGGVSAPCDLSHEELFEFLVEHVPRAIEDPEPEGPATKSKKGKAPAKKRTAKSTYTPQKKGKLSSPQAFVQPNDELLLALSDIKSSLISMNNRLVVLESTAADSTSAFPPDGEPSTSLAEPLSLPHRCRRNCSSCANDGAGRQSGQDFDLDCGDFSVFLKDNDPRVSKSLTLPEFNVAFGVFRDTIYIDLFPKSLKMRCEDAPILLNSFLVFAVRDFRVGGQQMVCLTERGTQSLRVERRGNDTKRRQEAQVD